MAAKEEDLEHRATGLLARILYRPLRVVRDAGAALSLVGLAGLMGIGGAVVAAFYQPYDPSEEGLALTQRLPVSSSAASWIARKDHQLTSSRTAVISGHTGGSRSVAVSREFLVIGGEDGTVRLWNRKSGKESLRFEGHEGAVTAVAFGGEAIASGGKGGTVRISDRESGEAIAQFEGHTGPVLSLAFGPDGGRLASAGNDGTVRLWNRKSGKEVARFEEHEGAVTAVDFVGQALVSGGADGTLRIWERGSETAVHVLERRSGSVLCVASGPSGETFVSGGDDGTVRLWDRKSQEITAVFDKHRAPVLSVAFGKTGTIASADEGGLVLEWKPDSGIATQFAGPAEAASSAALGPEGNTVAFLGKDGVVRMFGPDAQQFVVSPGGTSASSVAFGPEGEMVAVAAEDGTVRLRSGDGEETLRFDNHVGPVWSVAVGPEGEMLLSGGEDGTARLWNRNDETITRFDEHAGPVWSVAIGPKGELFASAAVDGTVRLWNRDGKEHARFDEHEGAILSVAIGPNGQRSASAGDDGTVRLWNRDGDQLAHFDRHDVAESVVFGPNAETLASSGDEGTFYLWDENGDQLSRFDGHPVSVWSIAFGPEGEMLASGGEDGTVRLWDVEGGKELALFEAHGGPVATVAFGPDADRLAFGTEGGTVGRLRIGSTQSLPPLWTYVSLVLGLSLVALFARMYRRARERKDARADRQRVAALLHSDGPLRDPRDAEGTAIHELSQRLSLFIRNRNTSRPLTVALTGEWGSGKTSAMRLLEHDLRRHNHPTVWFNAWHHQNETHLFASLMEQIRIDAAPGPFAWKFYGFSSLRFRLRLAWGRLCSEPLRYALFFALILLLLAVSSFLGSNLPVFSGATGLGAVVAAITLSRKLFVPIGSAPAALLRRGASVARFPRFQDKLSFRHHFAFAFNEVCRAFGNKPLTILIDDLDRCRPEHITDVLEAVNFLTSSGDCFLVLGVSEDPVRHAVGLHFDQIAGEQALARAEGKGATTTEVEAQDGIGESRDQEERSPEGREEVSSSNGMQRNGAGVEHDSQKARAEFAEQYLEKLFNLRVPVPPFGNKALAQWLNNTGGVDEGWQHVIQRVGRGLAHTATVAVLVSSGFLGWWLGSISYKEAIRPWIGNQGSQGASSTAAPVARDERDQSEGRQGSAEGGQQPPTSKRPPSKDSTPRERPRSAKATGQFAGPGPDTPSNVEVPEGTDASFLATKTFPALVLAILLIGGSVAFLLYWRSRRTRQDWNTPRDSDVFQECLSRYAPLVLAHHSSPRAIKRFANRVRFLIGNRTIRDAQHMDGLFLLAAFHEVGVIDHETSFAMWSQGDRLEAAEDATRKVVAMGTETPITSYSAEHIQAVGQSHWEEYWELALSVRFSREQKDSRPSSPSRPGSDAAST